MGRSPCCSKVGLRRGPWSTKEDTLLTNYIQQNGEGQWRSLPKKAGLLRCGKSCRLRWMNYLRPGIKRGNISQDEEDLIVRLHGLLGNRWSLIAGRLPGRTDNEIKNYWNTHLLKKLQSAGINPQPHKDIPKKTKGKDKEKKPAGDATAAGTGASGKKKKSKPKKKNINNNPDGSEKKKEEEQQPLSAAAAAAAMEEERPIDDSAAAPKMNVYLPKPIRVSSAFSRTNSYDSLASGTSSSDGAAVEKAAAEVASYVPVVWPSPLFELEEVNGGEDDDLLGVGRILPLLHHQMSDSMSGDVNMWEKVYDEYLQLL